MTDDSVSALQHQLECRAHGFEISVVTDSREVEGRRRELCCHYPMASLPSGIYTDRAEVTEVLFRNPGDLQTLFDVQQRKHQMPEQVQVQTQP